MTALRLLVSDSHDPLFNLAVEECIFRQMDPNQRVLFLWRNANTVVIGRAQNPWKECNTRRMEEDGVTLARRSSGGVAVFHDLGNSCFTFMAGKPGYDKSISTAIALDALKLLGVSAFASGRNDLLVATQDGDRKVSGSAYRETHDRGFHHGTLLLDADLSRLANYLNPDPKKLAAKGISSVRSRVANLCELLPGIEHQQVSHALIEAFFAHYGARVSPDPIAGLARLCRHFRPPAQLGVEFWSCACVHPSAGRALRLVRGGAAFRCGEGGHRSGADLQRQPGSGPIGCIGPAAGGRGLSQRRHSRAVRATEGRFPGSASRAGCACWLVAGGTALTALSRQHAH